MSTVRMCDDCGTVFSERADDWSTYTGSVRRRDKATGKLEVLSDTLDRCPECTERVMMVSTRPQIASSASPRYEHDDASA